VAWLTKVVALDYAMVGLRINAACPGYTRTPMIDRVVGRDPVAKRRMVLAEPMGRLGAP
jgi:NAD(P)-dependent dehydrogenase (short-subunit alcohol dehydrogenase family)